DASGGLHLSAAQLDKALEPFRKIRKAVGRKIDVMVDFHGLWNLTQAKRIAHALEELEPYWLEDPIKMDNIDALAEYAHSTRIPVCASETLGTRWSFRQIVGKGAA